MGGTWIGLGYEVGLLKYSLFPWDVIFFWVGGGGGIGWYLKQFDDGYLGVKIGFGCYPAGTLRLFWFFIYLRGEQEGNPLWFMMSTAASFAGQFTISSIVILYFGSKCKTLDKKALATSGKPSVNWSNG